MWPFKKKRTDQDIIDEAETYGECIDRMLTGNNITLGSGIFDKFAQLTLEAKQAKRRIERKKPGEVAHLKQVN